MWKMTKPLCFDFSIQHKQLISAGRAGPFSGESHLEAGGSLSLLAWEGAGRAQEAEHLVHHVRVVDRLQASLLHLLHHLLLLASLLLLLLLPLGVLLGQLGQTLLGNLILHDRESGALFISHPYFGHFLALLF